MWLHRARPSGRGDACVARVRLARAAAGAGVSDRAGEAGLARAVTAALALALPFRALE